MAPIPSKTRPEPAPLSVTASAAWAAVVTNATAVVNAAALSTTAATSDRHGRQPTMTNPFPGAHVLVLTVIYWTATPARPLASRRDPLTIASALERDGTPWWWECGRRCPVAAARRPCVATVPSVYSVHIQ